MSEFFKTEADPKATKELKKEFLTKKYEPKKMRRGRPTEEERKERAMKAETERRMEPELTRELKRAKKIARQQRREAVQQMKLEKLTKQKEKLEAKHAKQLEIQKTQAEIKLLKKQTSPFARIKGAEIGKKIRMRRREISLSGLPPKKTISRKRGAPPSDRQSISRKGG